MAKSKNKKRAGPGKPEFSPSEAQRKDVKLFAAAGMSEEGIAAALDPPISRNTLRKYFSVELEQGSAIETAKNLRRLDKAAEDGNVTAMKHLALKFGTVAATNSFDAPEAQDQKPLRTPQKRGKKEQADLDATTAGAGTEWDNDLRVPPTPPGKLN